ncbi:hypothetical protein BDR26DRAFT_241779 [Obelidium mucronatum]|nr:hypothetical protein BDR26DRAFT_241779 [Obelidium mucronatum]
MTPAFLVSLLSLTATLVSSHPILNERQGVMSQGWTSCGGYSTINALMIGPYNPPYPIYVQSNGNTNNQIGLRSGNVTVKMVVTPPNGTPFIAINKEYNLCTDLPGINCPIPAGHALLQYSIPAPTAAQSSVGLTAEVTIVITDQDKKVYQCITNPFYDV